MSLNLWKIGGQPTSYNPLPAGFIGNMQRNQFLEYVVKFNAKSASGAVLRVSDSITTYSVTLSSALTTYQYSFSTSGTLKTFWFNDQASKGDIIIDSIELVQKPLPKLTINGISNVVSDWEQGSIASDGSKITIDNGFFYNRLRLIKHQFPALPNTTYSVSSANGYEVSVDSWQSGNNTRIATTSWGTKMTFTTASNVNLLSIVVRKPDNSNLTTSEIVNAQPMLNLGTIPAPYEAKRGDKMVMPVARKNLFDAFSTAWRLQSGLGASAFGQPLTNYIKAPNNSRCTNDCIIKVKPNTTYSVILSNPIYDWAYATGDAAGNTLGDAGWQNRAASFTTGNNVYYVAFVFRKLDNTNFSTANDLRDSCNIQVEEGTTATAYTPYAVQVNPRPKKWVPKKNLIPSFKDSRWIMYTGTTIIDDVTLSFNNSTGGIRESKIAYIPVLPNTNYVFSAVHNATLSIWGDQTSTRILNYTTEQSAVFNTGINTTITAVFASPVAIASYQWKNPMLEQGSTATVFEPYTLVLPRAKTGVAFNGLTDYLQLPSMTMDSVEIECLIDAVQPTAGAYFIDARTGLTNGYFWNTNNAFGNGWASVLINGNAIASGQSNSVPINQRIKMKLNASAAFTDNVNIFSNNAGATGCMKGILYKVTCYLNNAIVAQYDFENNRFTAGSSVLPSVVGGSKNLWNGQLELGTILLATGATTAATNKVRNINFVPVKPSTSYTLSCSGGYKYSYVYFYDVSGAFISYSSNAGTPTFTTPSNCYNLKFILQNATDTTVTVAEFANVQVQLEEGSAATAYSPYSWNLSTQAGNLIPSFEDARWSIHANAKVLGRDVLHLDATATSNISSIDLIITPGKQYYLTCQTNARYAIYRMANGSLNGALVGYSTTKPATFTADTDTVRLLMTNDTLGAGSYDFIRPQLYQLNGKEGTLNGSPIQLNKHAKRRLYSKR